MCECPHGEPHRVDDHQGAVVGPGAQLHAAVLQVEGEVQHDDLTVALEDGGWVPGDLPGVLQQNLGLVDDGKVPVSTGRPHRGCRGMEGRSQNDQWMEENCEVTALCLHIYIRWSLMH